MKKHMNVTTAILTVETYENNMFGFDALNLGFDMPNYDNAYEAKHLPMHRFKRWRN